MTVEDLKQKLLSKLKAVSIEDWKNVGINAFYLVGLLWRENTNIEE